MLAQAIKTDTSGLAAGDFTIPVAGFNVPIYEARPASGQNHPIVLVISEVFGLHEYIKDSARRFAKQGYHAVARSFLPARAAWPISRTSRRS